MSSSKLALKGSDNNLTIAGRDINQIHVNIEEIETAQIKLLVPAQRTQLNTQVQELATTYTKEIKEIWRLLHAELSVRGIREVQACQYSQATTFLEKLNTQYKQEIINKN